jgi:GT2 family glycosyltransferase
VRSTKGRVVTDGKFFAVDGSRFRFRGVTYGTFGPRPDGALYPERDIMRNDVAAMARAGFTVIRTYTAPPDDLIELAGEHGVRLFPTTFYPDWRYLVGASRRDRRRVLREARDEVRSVAKRLAGSAEIAAVSVGNEVPADVVRWMGERELSRAIAELADVVHETDPELLVTYANYPSTEYLSLPTLDFITFNVFLERRLDFRRYLRRLHNLTGDRPLVLGEIGLDADAGEQTQAETIDWQLDEATGSGVAGTCIFSWTDDWSVGGQRVDGWKFGLTRADRSPRKALHVAAAWNERTMRNLREEWPSLSVVICAHNAAATIDECLRHTCSLDYPNLDVVVVDDGSTDASATVAEGHPRARLIRLANNEGLSNARNAGTDAASGGIVAFLDADAYPAPEWPYAIALGFEGSNVGGVGGPNLVPVDDGEGAQRVARAPGGPVHVLLSDDRAEHIPGCNMAFRRHVLTEVGGFDPAYVAAGDDVDFCWKVLDRGWEIAFHPPAFVWHHRRGSLRAYLGQQAGYGRAESLVQARHPDRFTAFGSARWQGSIYDSFAPHLVHQRVYRGLYGLAAYQSVYRSRGHGLDVAHQIGLPVALLAVLASPLAIVTPVATIVAATALALVAALGVADYLRTDVPHETVRNRRRFRVAVAVLHLLQPFARTWGRVRGFPIAYRDLPPAEILPGPVRHGPGRSLAFPADRSRLDLAAAIIANIRRRGFRVIGATGWNDYDALVLCSGLVAGRVVTSHHPGDTVQLRVRALFRLRPLLAAVAIVGGASIVDPRAGIPLLAAVVLDVLRGQWRARRGILNALARRTGVTT